MADMPKLLVTRYTEKDSPIWSGCVQPPDHSWILYVRRDGGLPVLYTDRDPVTGAVRSLEHDG